jgi:hypothetical protein
MSFNLRSTPELVQVAAAGGGFRLDAGLRSTPELVQIAAAAASGGGYVTFAEMNLRPTPELVQIAAAGKGHAIFEG